MQVGGDSYGRGDWLLFDREGGGGGGEKQHVSERCDDGINNALCVFIWTSDTRRLCIVGVRAGGRGGGDTGGGDRGNMNEWHTTVQTETYLTSGLPRPSQQDHWTCDEINGETSQKLKIFCWKKKKRWEDEKKETRGKAKKEWEHRCYSSVPASLFVLGELALSNKVSLY